MARKMIPLSLMVALLAILPIVVGAQTTDPQAPLGSKQNPIKPTLVQSASPTPTSKGKKGKRGSKTNPITGSVHPRASH